MIKLVAAGTISQFVFIDLSRPKQLTLITVCPWKKTIRFLLIPFYIIRAKKKFREWFSIDFLTVPFIFIHIFICFQALKLMAIYPYYYLKWIIDVMLIWNNNLSLMLDVKYLGLRFANYNYLLIVTNIDLMGWNDYQRGILFL